VARRQADAATGGLDHVVAGQDNVGAPIELLRLVFEKIASGKGVAIGFDIAPAGIARNRRVASAEFPAGMLSRNAAGSPASASSTALRVSASPSPASNSRAARLTWSRQPRGRPAGLPDLPF